MDAQTNGRLAVLVKGYPRLSETFIAQEILGLERRGIRQLIVSLRHPYDDAVHDMHHAIQADVLYLPEYLKDDPPRVRRACRAARELPGYDAARRAFEADLSRDKTANRHRRWGQACVLANELPSDIAWLHTHYLHTPASVTRYAAKLLQRPWSFSAHAKDIWTTPEWELRTKLGDAAWGATCTALNARHLKDLSPNPNSIHLVYHGLDIDALEKNTSDKPGSSTDTERRLGLVTVGRAVEKKGFDDLLKALARLPADLDWRLVHIGKGDQLDRLRDLSLKLGISERIEWRGAQPRDAVFAAYREADLFILSSKVAKSGDRDGLPNVLMEAQLSGLACIATAVSAIPELIIHAETGLLTEPGNPDALAAAIEQLLRDPKRRQRLAEAGRARVRNDFSCDPGLDFLAARFRASLVS